MNNLNIILNEEEGTAEILHTGYNIIAETIYNKNLVKKVVRLISEEIKQNNYNFTTLENFLKLK